MKNRAQLSFSVPRLIIQLTFAFLIGYFVQQGFLDPWIHNRSISTGLKSLLGFLSILLFFAPIFYLFVFRDLQRENKRYRHYLDQYKKFQVILDESPLGALIYDQSGFLYVSKKFCSIIGYDEGEILGKKFKN